MICSKCGSKMKKAMRFERGKSFHLYKCPICYIETKPKPLIFINEQIRRNNTKKKGRK